MTASRVSGVTFRVAPCLAATVLVLAGASTVFSQSVRDTGGRIAGSFGGSFGDGGSTTAATGSAGLRLTRHLGLDLELMYVPDLEIENGPSILPLLTAGVAEAGPRVKVVARIPVILPVEREARVIAFFSKLVAEFPVGDRLRPYLAGGGGPAHTRKRFRYRWPDTVRILGERGGSAMVVPFPVPGYEVSETTLGLTIGGGLDVRVWRDLAAGVDIRYVRFLGGIEDLDLGQIAARVSYRF